jgi:hypothetical protein
MSRKPCKPRGFRVFAFLGEARRNNIGTNRARVAPVRGVYGLPMTSDEWTAAGIYDVEVSVPGEGTWCAEQRTTFNDRMSELTPDERRKMPSVKASYDLADGWRSCCRGSISPPRTPGPRSRRSPRLRRASYPRCTARRSPHASMLRYKIRTQSAADRSVPRSALGPSRAAASGGISHQPS